MQETDEKPDPGGSGAKTNPLKCGEKTCEEAAAKVSGPRDFKENTGVAADIDYSANIDYRDHCVLPEYHGHPEPDRRTDPSQSGAVRKQRSEFF